MLCTILIISQDLSTLASKKSFHERALEVFTSPSALTFISLLLAILVMALAALLVVFWRGRRFSLVLLGSKKWSKAANKVVQEANLIYPWTSQPQHNCVHQVTKDTDSPSAASYIGLRSSNGTRNLQVRHR